MFSPAVFLSFAKMHLKFPYIFKMVWFWVSFKKGKGKITKVVVTPHCVCHIFPCQRRDGFQMLQSDCVENEALRKNKSQVGWQPRCLLKQARKRVVVHLWYKASTPPSCLNTLSSQTKLQNTSISPFAHWFFNNVVFCASPPNPGSCKS